MDYCHLCKKSVFSMAIHSFACPGIHGDDPEYLAWAERWEKDQEESVKRIIELERRQAQGTVTRKRKKL